MKKKLFIIAIPIVISIFGIIWLQIDWINKTYMYELKKMNSLADSALRHAINANNSLQLDSVMRFLKPKLSPLTDSVNMVFSDNDDSLIVKLNNQIRFKEGLYGLERQAYDVERVEIEWPIYDVFPNGMLKKLGLLTRENDKKITDKLDEILKPFIKTRDSIYYKSDSLKIKRKMQKYLSSYGIDEQVQLYFLKGDFSKLKTQSVREYRPLGINRYTGERRWVGFYFRTHNDYIIKKMLYGSILSIVLVFIMIVSFIYLVRTILKQKQLAEMKDDFINNLTHEFKTPIATISVAIEGMQNFNALKDPEKTNRYLAISKSELNRLNSMVSNVLNVASQEKNSIELDKIEVSLEEIVKEVIGMEYFRTTKAVNFNVTINKDANLIKVDPFHFKNVLTNLVDNAVKYANDVVEITISAIIQQNRLCLKIKDNGIGIPTSSQKYIFDKFYRVSNGNIYNVKGIGLGLSYVKSIILAHDGSITVKSEVGFGTEFTIFIPLS